MQKKLSTEPYKGTRDFYPEDMAIQRYIFDTWAETAESFGFERYDSSIFEPSELYKSKGAENEEMVNEQTYTFKDRGDREVTLRPEMTPTVARMIAGKRRELSFPVRWYSIPNLYRYERPQRGRLREFWQLNCDMFGADHYTSDVEMIALAYNIFTAFGATSDMFEIRVNSRAWINEILKNEGLDEAQSKAMIALLDRKDKIDNFVAEAKKIAGKHILFDNLVPDKDSDLYKVIEGLKALGITNVKVSVSIVRGFNYYTGTVFEVFDTSPENNRAMMGGGRFDNLTELFGGDAITGIGFGMGDVIMKDFLITHNLLTSNITAPSLMIIPTDEAYNLEGQILAQSFRQAGISVAVDMSTKKIGKKLSSAGEAFVAYALILGEDEVKSKIYTLKNLTDSTEQKGTADALIDTLTN
jgi:histidyl-tRNA synthetase